MPQGDVINTTQESTLHNIDPKTVSGFGDEWSRFKQDKLAIDEANTLFEKYFSEFPWESLKPDAVGVDVGCGSGRWAKLVAPRVGTLHCIDASADALNVAKGNLKGITNCEFNHCSVDQLPFADGSLDFAYSLGVLHHVPDTKAAIQSCVQKLKPGAPFLVYLYYRFDNRPLWFRTLWRVSDMVRRVVARLPYQLRYWVSQLIALLIYWPLARLARVGEILGLKVSNWPLSFYRNHSFYTMRTDALDRFGTRLEQRFTVSEIKQMLIEAGCEKIKVRDGDPYWCVVGVKR